MPWHSTCRICGKDGRYHALYIVITDKEFHPFVGNNLEYLEYLYDQKEKANV